MTDDHALRCVILGAGHAAAQCAVSLRKDGWVGSITLIGDEPSLPYHRPPLSKGYLKGDTTLDSMLIRPRALYDQNNITLELGRRAMHLDRARQTVQLDDGREIPYDRLVLATGSVCRRPAIAGLDRPGVYFLRSAADADRLRAVTANAARVVLVGGGYISLELAASFRKQGLSVTVLERNARLLARVTAPEVSAFFQSVHEAEGVEIHTGVAVLEITGDAPALQVVARDGRTFAGDLVILGTGALPNTALAEAAGLEVDNGILVDEQNRTSDPHLFAIGDCARQHHPHYQRLVRLESVQNAVEQAKTASAALTGKPIPRRPLPWFWSDQYDIKLQIAGLSTGYTDLVLRGTPDQRRSFSAWYFQGPALLAVDTVNDPLAYVVGSKLIEGKAAVDRAALAQPEGDLKALLTRTRGA